MAVVAVPAAGSGRQRALQPRAILILILFSYFFSYFFPFQSCRWFARYAGWGPGQLQRECRAGVWFTAAASPDLILQLPKESNGRDYWHTVRGMGVAGRGDDRQFGQILQLLKEISGRDHYPW